MRRRVLLVTVGVLGFFLLSLSGAWLWLQSAAGENEIRSRLVEALNAQLSANVSIRKMTLSNNRISFTDLQWLAPDGITLLRIDRLEASVDFAQLAARRLVVSDLQVDTLNLSLEPSARAHWRALTKTGPSAGPTSKPWSVIVEHLQLTRGTVRIDHQKVVEDLTAEGKLKLMTGSSVVDADLTLSAQHQNQPLQARVQSFARPQETTFSLLGKWGQSEVEGQMTLPGLEVELKRLHISQKQAAAYVEGWPFEQDLLVSATRRGSKVSARVAWLDAKATLEATLDDAMSGFTAFEIALVDAPLDPWIQSAAPLRLGFSATGSVENMLEANRSVLASVGLQLKTGPGEAVLDASTQLAFDQSGLGWTTLEMRSKGLRLKSSGSLTPEKKVNAEIETWVDHARPAIDTVNKLFPGAVDSVNFKGHGLVTVEGLWPVLRIESHGTLDAFRWPAHSLETDGVSFALTLADASNPLSLSGVLTAETARYGERRLNSIQGVVVNRGSHFDASLSTRGLGDVALEVSVNRQGPKSVQIESARLLYEGETWALSAPVQLAFDSSSAQISPFSLVAGAQRIDGQWRQRRSTFEVNASVQRLRLERLPEVILPKSLDLRGELNASALVVKTPAGFEGSIQFSLSEAQLRGVALTQMDGQLQLSGQQASGSLRAFGPLTTVEASARGQLLAKHDGLSDWTVDAKVAQLDVSHVARLAGPNLQVRGLANGTLLASQSQNVLTLNTRWQSVKMAVETPKGLVEADDVIFEMSTDPGGVKAKVQGKVDSTDLVASFESPEKVAKIAQRRWTRAGFETLLGSLRLETKSLDLDRLARFQSTAALKGNASIEVELKGSLADPVGHAKIQLARAQVENLTNLNGVVELSADRQALSAKLDVAQEGQGALQFAGKIDSSAWLSDSPREAAIWARAQLKDFHLAQLSPATASVGGRASVNLMLDGSVGNPLVSLTGVMANLSYQSVSLGQVDFSWKGVAAQQQLTMSIENKDGELLRASGLAGLDLTRSNGRWKVDGPLLLAVRAQGVPLAPVAVFDQRIRRVAGKASATGQIGGRLTMPTWKGSFALADGLVSLSGLGEYREIALKGEATQDKLEVSQFFLKSGAGTVNLTGKAQRQPGSLFRVSMGGRLNQLPVVVDDQLLANVTVSDLSVAGDLNAAVLDFHTVSATRVEVELPDIKRKNLQGLEKAPGVVVLQKNKPREMAAVKQPVRSERSVRMGFSVPRNLWVKSSDLNLELGLSDDFRVEVSSATQVFGEVRLLKGKIDVLGRQFQVAAPETGVSTVRFDGVATVPLLNVVVVHSNERERVKVRATVVGRGRSAQLELTADPPMAESDIYTLLATGRKDLRRSANASITPEQALSVVGSLAASQLRGALSKKLPLDVFSLDTGSEGVQSTRLELGTYLSDRFYLGSTVQPGANQTRGESIFSGKLEYQLSKSWTVEGNAGTAPTFGLDFIWSRDF